MLTSLMLSLALAAPQAPAQPAPSRGSSEPPVRLSLNSDGQYRPGDRARVHVRSEEDGYLVVLRTDVDGWVRVLFPVDPSDDDFVRGGQEFEVRDRGDREAFTVSRHDGTGVILAAFSTTPFTFQQFTLNGHWDYRVLDTLRSDSDQEAALLAIADGMAANASLEYDAMNYTVGGGGYGDQSYAASSYYPSYYYPDSYWSRYDFGWYRPYYYRSAFYIDPFLFSCWGICYSRSYYALDYGYYRPWSYRYAYTPYRYNSWSRWGSSRFYGGRTNLAWTVRATGIFNGRQYANSGGSRVTNQRSYSRTSFTQTRRDTPGWNGDTRRTMDDRGTVQRDTRSADRSAPARRPVASADRSNSYRRDISSDRSSVARRDVSSGYRTSASYGGTYESRRPVSRESAPSRSSGDSYRGGYSGGRPSSGDSRPSRSSSSGYSGGRSSSGGGGRASSGGGYSGGRSSSGGGGRASSSGGNSGGGRSAPSGGGGGGRRRS